MSRGAANERATGWWTTEQKERAGSASTECQYEYWKKKVKVNKAMDIKHDETTDWKKKAHETTTKLVCSDHGITAASKEVVDYGTCEFQTDGRE